MNYLGETESEIIQQLTVVEGDVLVLSPNTLGRRHARTIGAKAR
jgi:hypothetical protein